MIPIRVPAPALRVLRRLAAALALGPVVALAAYAAADAAAAISVPAVPAVTDSAETASPRSSIAVTEAADATPGLGASDAWRSSQAALGHTIGDYTLLDRRSQPVRLAGYRGKPLLVSFIYTGCFQVCPTTTRGLYEAVETLQKRFGTHRFNVISVGFNQPADSPQAMKAYAKEQRVDSPDWDFLSPHPAIVAPLTADFGFRWRATPAGFDHVIQTSVIDAQGRLVRQVYGDRLAAGALGDVLEPLFNGTVPPEPTRFEALFDRVRLLCTIYDPLTGTDRVDYALAFEIAGGVTFLLTMMLYVLNEWRTQRRARRLTPRKPLGINAAQTLVD